MKRPIPFDIVEDLEPRYAVKKKDNNDVPNVTPKQHTLPNESNTSNMKSIDLNNTNNLKCTTTCTTNGDTVLFESTILNESDCTATSTATATNNRTNTTNHDNDDKYTTEDIDPIQEIVQDSFWCYKCKCKEDRKSKYQNEVSIIICILLFFIHC
jgi:hypothetical protein